MARRDRRLRVARSQHRGARDRALRTRSTGVEQLSKRNQKLGEVIKRMAMVASTINEPASPSTASADEPTEEDYAIQGPFARPLWASLHPAVHPQPTAPVEDVQPICGEGTTYEDAPDLHTGCALNAGHKGPHSDGDYSWDGPRRPSANTRDKSLTEVKEPLTTCSCECHHIGRSFCLVCTPHVQSEQVAMQSPVTQLTRKTRGRNNAITAG